jgi:hypothetical protein
VLRDLARVCSFCDQKERCARDIAPVAYRHIARTPDTLRALLAERGPDRVH